MQILESYWIRNCEVRPSNLCFNKLPGWFWCIWKFENCWCRHILIYCNKCNHRKCVHSRDAKKNLKSIISRSEGPKEASFEGSGSVRSSRFLSRSAEYGISDVGLSNFRVRPFQRAYKDLETLKLINYKQWLLIYWWDFWVVRGEQKGVSNSDRIENGLEIE